MVDLSRRRRTGATAADGPEPYGNHSWDDGFSGIPTAAPTVANGTAYLPVLTERDSFKIVGAVTAYDAASGDVEWERTDLGEPNGAPTVVDGTAYVSTTAFLPPKSIYVERNGDGGLYALNATTGETEWVRNESADWSSAPVYADGTVYAIEGPEALDLEDRTSSNKTVGNRSLVALNPETGETRWSAPGDRLLGVVDGTAFVEDDGDLVAYDTDARERLWRRDVPSALSRSGYAITDDGLYTAVTTDDGVRATAFSPSDGSVLWNRTVSNATADHGSVSVGDDGVFLTLETDVSGGEVVRLDAATGAEEWRYTPKQGHLSSGPTVANDTVYVGGAATSESQESNGNWNQQRTTVFAVDAHDGAQEWGYRFDETGVPKDGVRAPSVTDDGLYVPSYESGLYAESLAADLYALESSSTPPGPEHVPSDGVNDGDESEPEPVVEANITYEEEVGRDDGFGAVLYGWGSSARNGSIASYEWDLDGDGTFDRNSTAAAITLGECEFTTITLRVTTEDGETDTDSITLPER